jgi:hypothetical protein
MNVQERTTDNKRRFRIEKLEERIAPGACGNPCDNRCHRNDCDSFSLKVDVDVSLKFGGCCN